MARSEVVSDRVAVAYLDSEDVRALYPDLSEDQVENILGWLESNSTLTERPGLARALIQEAMATLGIRSEEG